MEIGDAAAWFVVQALGLANSAPGWLLKLNPATGAVLGYIDVTDGHVVTPFDSGKPVITGAGRGLSAVVPVNPLTRLTNGESAMQ